MFQQSQLADDYLSHLRTESLDLGEVQVSEDEGQSLRQAGNLSTGIDRLNERLGVDSRRNEILAKRFAQLDEDWQVVVFAGSVDHAKLLAVALTDHGVSARPVWGDLPRWARRDAIESFRSGETRVITNYNVLSEGFDAPKARAVVVARFVQSDALFLQMLGRGMRGPLNGGTSDCLLLTMGESLPVRFDTAGDLDVKRFEYLWSS